ncbi:MAG: rhomboid family intramembrane serine protease [Bacteroidota bacterium]
MYQQGGGILDEFKNAFKRPNNELIQIILINLAVFVVLIILKVFLTLGGSGAFYGDIVRQLTLPSDLGDFLFRPWTIVTYFFTHEGFFHILFNMLFLYWFGKLIVEYLGSHKVVVLYIIGGLTGGLFFMLIYNLLPYFQDRVAYSVMLGASAGVYAVTVAAATLLPNYTFMLMFLGPVKIKYIAIFYVFLSFAQTVGDNAGGELAHLGGAFIGFYYIKQLQQGNDFGRWVITTMDWFKGLFEKKSKIKVTYKKPKSSVKTTTSKTEQEEIDHILDKISESGYDSLSKDEKEKLFNASKN